MTAPWDPPRSPGPKLPEARDRLAAKRKAWDFIARVIGIADWSELRGQEDVQQEVAKHLGALANASRVEDSPNLSEHIDGNPGVAKCKDMNCVEHSKLRCTSPDGLHCWETVTPHAGSAGDPCCFCPETRTRETRSK